jgi:excisionase family DNA binding protein
MAEVREGPPDSSGLPTGRATFRRAEVAALLGVSLSTVDRAIADGDLAAFRLRGAVLISAPSLRSFIRSTEVTARQAEAAPWR